MAHYILFIVLINKIKKTKEKYHKMESKNNYISKQIMIMRLMHKSTQ
jgi:hypothetical protein